jgi:hypothetical protein
MTGTGFWLISHEWQGRTGQELYRDIHGGDQIEMIAARYHTDMLWNTDVYRVHTKLSAIPNRYMCAVRIKPVTREWLDIWLKEYGADVRLDCVRGRARASSCRFHRLYTNQYHGMPKWKRYAYIWSEDYAIVKRLIAARKET